MKHWYKLLPATCLLVGGISMAHEVMAPVAKKVAKKMVQHGDTRIDNYYWLRDDERKDPEVLAYLNQENAYTDSKLAHTEKLQKALYSEFIGRIKKDDSSVPYKSNGYWYLRRFESGKEYAIYSRKSGSLDNKEELLLDTNVEAAKHDYYSLGDLAISPNNRLMAWSDDTVSRRQYTLHFKDLKTGKIYPESIANTSGSVVWANDNKTVFYVRKDPVSLLGYQVFRHELGTSVDSDVLVYEEKDRSYYTYVFKTRSDDYIGIYHDSTESTGVSFLDADKPKGRFVRFTPRTKGLEYEVEHFNDTFYIRTNQGGAKNFKLMSYKTEALAQSTKTSQWTPFVPYHPDVFIQDFLPLKDYFVIRQKVNGQSELVARRLKDGKITKLKFDENAYSVGFSVNEDVESNSLRFSYSSLTTPRSVFEQDLQSGTRTLLKEREIPSGYNKDLYKSERIWVAARDGAQVPVTLVYRKDKFKKDGTNPLLQYAYGSYGSNVDPRFSTMLPSLLDRGFVYAIAHIRGSSFLGREWYENGKKLNKINTFSDFIDVGQYLANNGYAAKDKLFAMGGSAGGLLMGAVVNMAPEQYKGVIAAVPFVDVVTTMLDESIPLTTNEYDEWGNPNQKDFYDYMLSYSPYDQVSKQAYPNLLVTTGLWDSQVQYFEPAKWVAKLREFKTGNNLLLLKTDMSAGHGGASGRFKRYEDRAFNYAFLLDLAGIKE